MFGYAKCVFIDAFQVQDHKWFEPRSSIMIKWIIVWVSLVLRRTVEDDMTVVLTTGVDHTYLI